MTMTPDFQTDQPPQGDVMWRGVNLRTHPASLEPGWLAGARNMRCQDGKPKSRAGCYLLPWLQPVPAFMVRLASTANLSLSGAATVDGKAVVTGDRVLAKNQTTTTARGIYVANTAGAWTRATDLNASAEFVNGSRIAVRQGDTNVNTVWTLGVSGGFVMDTNTPTFTAANHFAAISGLQGVGVFADPDDLKWIVYAAGGAVYYCGPGMAARSIALPAGVSIAGETVEFVQAMDVLLMFRGTASNPLVLRAVTDVWEEIVQKTNDPLFSEQNPDDGTDPIPPAEWALALQNRVILPNTTIGKDVFSVSDYFNFTRYQPTLASFRINQGDEQAVVAGYEVPTPDDTPSSAMLVFKENSVFIVSGIVGDLEGLALQTVTKEYSCANRKAIWRVGRDVWFVSAGRGVSSITQTAQNKLQGVDVPVSLDIQPLIARINWQAKAKMRGAKVGNFSYIAVPLDGSSANNALLVFDHLNQAWAGYDNGVAVAELLPFTYQGVERLFILTTGGYFGLYEEVSADATSATAWTAIDFSATTRGYPLQSTLGRMRATGFTMQLKTWGPRYTVTATMDGAAETQTLASQKTKSRLLYYRPHMKAPWVNSNVNLDHGTAYRQDYSLDWSDDVWITSLNFDLYQETLESYRPPRGTRGFYTQFTVANDRGRAELHGVSVESQRIDQRRGTHK
jgi:hypothetical protein